MFSVFMMYISHIASALILASTSTRARLRIVNTYTLHCRVVCLVSSGAVNAFSVSIYLWKSYDQVQTTEWHAEAYRDMSGEWCGRRTGRKSVRGANLKRYKHNWHREVGVIYSGPSGIIIEADSGSKFCFRTTTMLSAALLQCQSKQ